MGASRKSPLSSSANAKRNTQAGRAKMPTSDFAEPGAKQYRIDDAAHARDALSRVAQYGTAAEKREVRAAVAKKYPGIAQSGGSKNVTKRQNGK